MKKILGGMWTVVNLEGQWLTGTTFVGLAMTDVPKKNKKGKRVA